MKKALLNTTSKGVGTLLATFLLLLSGVSAAHAIVYTTSGASTNWNNPLAWTPAGGPPGANDTIIVNHNISMNVAVTVNGLLTVSEGVTVSGANRSLTINATGVVTINGTMTVSTLTTETGAVMTVNGTFSTGGNLSNKGTIYNNGVINVGGNLQNNPGGRLTGNNGTFNISNNGINSAGGFIDGVINFRKGDPCTNPFNNANSGTIDYSTVTVCGVPFPVVWGSISAQHHSDHVALNWNCTVLPGSHFFVVERSADAAEFVEVDQQPAIVGVSQYETKDKAVVEQPMGANTNVYYRIRQVDYNGQVQFSPLVEVQLSPANSAIIRMGANPAPFEQQVVSIYLPDVTNSMSAEISLMDLSGKLLAQTSLDLEASVTTTLPLSQVFGDGLSLVPGVYILRVWAANTRQVLRVQVL